jgi:hypothetical protein
MLLSDGNLRNRGEKTIDYDGHWKAILMNKN